MKKLIRIALLSVALLASVVANASEKLNVKVASKTSKILSISLAEVTKGETIYIKDFNGEILFSEELDATHEYNKVFSFSTLPEGLYYIEDNEEGKIQSTPILVSKEDVSLVENSAKTYIAPDITIKNDVMNVLINNDTHSDVSISIYNEAGTLLNKSNHNTNTIVLGSFDISKLTYKKLTVSVTEGDYNFTKEIEL